MAIVWECELPVKAYAAAGKSVEVPRPNCPSCGTPMWFSSGYPRNVRAAGEVFQIWVRRARCKSKSCPSHALLPSFCLQGRRDTVEVIGAAVEASVLDGLGARRVAKQAGVYLTTARSWCRRHRQRARWALALVASLAAVGTSTPAVVSAEEVALAALDVGSVSAHRGPTEWRAVSLRTGGGWLAPP